MNNIVVINGLRFLVFTLIQLLVLKRASSGWEGFFYLNVLLYPLFILLLPLRTPKALIVFLGFLLGLSIDIGYGSIGVHAGTCVATAYLRSYVLKWTEPREGYNVNHSPNFHHLGAPWFLRYSAILMFFHIFIYFWIDAFSHIYFLDIVLKTAYTFVFSMFIIFVFMFLFNPKN
jgi:hypothetical protein